MKMKPNLIRAIFASLAFLASPLAVHSGKAAVVHANEFWISTDATGNFYSRGAGGTIDDPLDGSSRTNFDTNMNSLPPDSTIHIMAGTYQTLGNNGWHIKTGQKILGSGIDVTVVQLVSRASSTAVIESEGSLTNCEVSDLTCDCNYTGGYYSRSGLIIDGTHNAVRRVRVIHNSAYTHGRYSEVWGISLTTYHIPEGTGNIIEECEVSEFAGGSAGGSTSSDLYAITLPRGTVGIVTLNKGVIRDCHVLGGVISRDHQIFAYGAGSGCLIEGNYAEGVEVGTHLEDGATNLIYVHNTFKQCGVPVDLEGRSYHNLTFAFNDFELTDTYMGSPIAFQFANGEALSLTNVNIMGNTISYSGSVARRPYFLYVYNVTGLNVAYNTIDSRSTNVISNCSNVNMDNNYDLSGNYFGSMNIPAVGGRPVGSYGLGFINSADSSSALTYLGLPDMPSAIVTNNASRVTLSGDFNGNGGGLTNIPPAIMTAYTATNTLTVFSTGLTNSTADTYLCSITAGSAMTLKDGNGNQFMTPDVNSTFPLKPNWKLSGTAITGTAVIMNR
jgi:hypothetical protein